MGKGGESDAPGGHGTPSTSVLSQPQFAPFQEADFDVAQFTSRVLAGSHTTASAQSDALREGVRLLETELASDVSGHSGELLGHVQRMSAAESSLQDVVLGVGSLQAAVGRIRGEIVGPYEVVKTKTRQLTNLHATIDTLRLVIHRIKLTAKLRAQLGAAPQALDLAKAAKLITDIRAVDAEADLTGIDAIAADEAFLRQATASVRQQAEEALVDGMDSLSQAKVGSALQVFFNLEELGRVVQGQLGKYLGELEKAAKAALDPRTLGAPSAATIAPGRAGAAVGGPGGSSGWQDALWGGLRELADTLQRVSTAVWHLQRVVAKKRDPLSHVCFLDELSPPGAPLPCRRFWDECCRVLGDALAAVTKQAKSGGLRDVLIAGYPRLAVLLEGMFERLMSETTIKGVLPGVTPEQLPQLTGCAAPLEKAYRSACLNLMADAAASAFPGGARSLPSPADVQKLIGVMHEELRTAGTSPHLAGVIGGEVASALRLLSRKAEYMAATGPDVRSMAAVANPSQLRNIALASQLQEVHRSLSALLPRLPFAASPGLVDALGCVQVAAIEAVAPMFKATVEAAEDALLHMHERGYGDSGGGPGGDSAGPPPMVDTSAYVADATQLLASFRSEFLSRFVPPPSPNVSSCAGALVERMACRLLIFFVRHAALVRPLCPHGSLQLAKDLAEMQLAVSQSLFPLEQLPVPYRMLKAFRALLFQDTSGMLASPLVRDLPPSITLHHLFSRLPPSVRAPHERLGLSQQQYSLWLDEHGSADALEAVAASIEGAGGEVGGDGGATAEVLAVMGALCGARR